MGIQWPVIIFAATNFLNAAAVLVWQDFCTLNEQHVYQYSLGGFPVKFYYAASAINPTFYVPLAQALEAAGFDGVMVGDSIIYPQQSEADYPYNSDGSRSFLEQLPFIEPMSLFPAMAAVTEKLKFRTTIYKLPLRNPVLATKSATSVAVLSNNRLELGIGTGPWPEDFKASGQPWPKRGGRMDEMLEIFRGLEKGDYFGHEGSHYQLDPIKLSPVPSEPIPLLIGGHADVALRRAARHDGWIHAGGPHDEMVAAVQRLRELRQEQGKSMDGFDIHVGSELAFSPEGLASLAELGVTTVSIGFHDIYSGHPDEASLEQKIEQINGFAEQVIKPFRAG